MKSYLKEDIVYLWIRKENGVLLYRHDEFEIRINKPMFLSTIEIRRITVPYSCFLPVNIGMETMDKPYDKLMKEFSHCISASLSESCFSDCDIYPEDFFKKYQIFFFNGCKFEIGSCEGKRPDYLLCSSSRPGEQIQKTICHVLNCFNSSIRLFGAEFIIEKDKIRETLEQAGCTCLTNDKKHLIYENDEWIISISYFNFSCYLEIRRKS